MDSFLHSYGLSVTGLASAVIAAAVFASVLTVLLPLMGGSKLKNRMKVVAIERDEIRARERARMTAERQQIGRGGTLRQKDAQGLAALVVSRLNLRRALVDDKTVASLRVAGFRGQRPLTLFLFARVMLPLLFLFGAALYVFGLGLMAGRPTMVRVVVCLIVAMIGFYAPNIYVNNRAAKRRQSIMRAWPDALDLLLICVESGNSIEAAFRRVAEEIGVQSIALAEEFVLLGAELSYLPDRKTAYTNLATRTGVDTVRSVTTALVQAERYGTPLGTALRTLAQESRDVRMNAAEKKAAALPPKLTVPMILFFLPVLFAVIIGPAIIQVMSIR